VFEQGTANSMAHISTTSPANGGIAGRGWVAKALHWGGHTALGAVLVLCDKQPAWRDDITPNFFRDSPYIIDDQTVGTSATGHELHVAGVLKDKTQIIPPDITMGFCRLEFRDVGVSTFDPIMRQAEAQFTNPGFDSVTGISGSPVFDQAANVLCGMVARGAIIGSSKCIIHYIDFFDIFRFLKGIRTGSTSTYYTKTLTIPVVMPP
jgi:hypothetical protein